MISFKKNFNCPSCFTILSTIILCSFLLTSCLTAKKLDAEVAKVYSEKPVQKKKPNEQITVMSNLTAGGAGISTSQTKTSNVLPLIVYIGFNYRNICKLNPQIPVANFTSTVSSVASKGLMQKLQGQKLELTVDQIPNEFSIDDKGHMVLLLIGWDNISIQGKSTDMVVRYKLSGEGSLAKQGAITVPYPNDKMNLGYFKSWKKATAEYLAQYDANITAMTKVFVDKLLKEL